MKVLFDGPAATSAWVTAPGPGSIRPNQLMVLARVRIRHLRQLPWFVAAFSTVISQAQSHPGLLRFGFDVRWSRLDFTTVGVFTDAAALGRFLGGGAHAAIQARLGGRLGQLTVEHRPVPAGWLPASWQDVRDEQAAPARPSGTAPTPAG